MPDRTGLSVAISWSGERSLAIAGALRDWLPAVVQAINPWMSERDIRAGASWRSEVDNDSKQRT